MLLKNSLEFYSENDEAFYDSCRISLVSLQDELFLNGLLLLGRINTTEWNLQIFIL